MCCLHSWSKRILLLDSHCWGEIVTPLRRWMISFVCSQLGGSSVAAELHKAWIKGKCCLKASASSSENGRGRAARTKATKRTSKNAETIRVLSTQTSNMKDRSNRSSNKKKKNNKQSSTTTTTTMTTTMTKRETLFKSSLIQLSAFPWFTWDQTFDPTVFSGRPTRPTPNLNAWNQFMW